MSQSLSRRTILRLGFASTTALCSGTLVAVSQTATLSDIGAAISGIDPATIYVAREIVTMDPKMPTTTAVAVVGDRILGVGDLSVLEEKLGAQPYVIDRTFSDKVILPGLIEQHAHPVLAALTMSSEILAIEDWVLPSGTVPAVKDKADFMERLAAAVAAAEDPSEPLLTWGYHSAFFGELTRADLDQISTETPILVWARSCHEFILNSAAMDRGGVTQDVYDGFPPTAKAQSNFEHAHFWEQGGYAVLPYIAGQVASPERMRAGLLIARDYMHANGITIGNEPGGIQTKAVQDAVNEVFSSPDMPFRWSFMTDGKSLLLANDNDTDVLPSAEALVDWYGGMTSLSPKQVKLFADGAIYSLLMQVREAYLDGHEGEWIMDLDLFERGFRLFWDAGYQIHVHVNGDAGLDRVLNTLETNLRRNPRYDHRTVLVHFAVSAPDQIARIKELGAIVSANPYYVTALSDQYSEVGLGPERADAMVRLGDVDRAGISWSLHSDMPMAPGDPLFLMWCAVNRVTASGRVAGAEQRVSVEKALQGVTIEAAYSLNLEDEVGSIEPGKRANFTILDENPLRVDPMEIKDIPVWGTVMEGRILPGEEDDRDAALQPFLKNDPQADAAFMHAALEHALKVVHAHL